ncbi:uncharacterized protein B0P05DRAFT_520498 [Gilbertella persicaria]|uniref:uncharacterized protein n=1 Tax=Gilbertella persicaria TaxID=101096 RepID=UPI00221EA6E8|nr:uncharacterized protein B0P05DRAFT_520498 [Gilbertella persicaria]KAI8098119.1 hypothetical protein B0P05DRAFT_520498 [Gilbertella persicaria]
MTSLTNNATTMNQKPYVCTPQTNLSTSPNYQVQPRTTPQLGFHLANHLQPP